MQSDDTGSTNNNENKKETKIKEMYTIEQKKYREAGRIWWQNSSITTGTYTLRLIFSLSPLGMSGRVLFGKDSNQGYDISFFVAQEVNA